MTISISNVSLASIQQKVIPEHMLARLTTIITSISAGKETAEILVMIVVNLASICSGMTFCCIEAKDTLLCP
jgi:hypothetical protein